MSLSGFRAACIAIMLAVYGGSATADDRIIRVGFTSLPPYAFPGSAGDLPKGLAVDIILDAAARLGYETEFVLYDNPGELVDAVAAGQIDITSLLAISGKRAERASSTAPIGSFSLELSFADSPPAGALEGRLEGLRIGTSRGSFPDRLLSDEPGVTLVYLDTFSDRLIALLSGEVDAVTAPGSALHLVASDAGLSARLAEERFIFSSTENAFLVDPGQPALLRELNRAIGEAKADGTLSRITEFWKSPVDLTAAEWAVKHIVWLIVAVAGLVTALLAGIAAQALLNRSRRHDAGRTRTMIEAFDVARAGIVIYDRNLRAEVANAAFEAAFPGQVPGVRAGLTLPEMLRKSHANGYFGDGFDAAELDAFVERCIEKLESGEGFESSVRSPDGRVFSRRGLRMRDGRVAIVTTDVSELEESRRQLADRATELQLANERLEAFTRVAAHDLKSPAASAATLLDWIVDDLTSAKADPPESVWQTIEQARGLLRRQVVLIDDLLDYARAATQGGTAVRVAPGERIPKVLDLIDVPAGFHVAVEGDLAEIGVDLAAFDLVIRNLMSNAIKHHDRDTGHILIRSETHADTVLFEVIDDGPGVPEGFEERVFEPFFKLRSHEEVAGSGLGLAMLRATVSAWGGEISLRPRTPGRGTVVRFTAPLWRCEAEARKSRPGAAAA